MALSVGAVSSMGAVLRQGAGRALRSKTFNGMGGALVSTWSKAIAGIVLLALLFHGKAVYVAAYSLLALYFGFSRALRYAARCLELKRSLSSVRLFPGEQAVVTLEINNPSPFPLPYLLVEESVDRELAAPGRARYAFATSLPGRGSQKIEYVIQAKKRGVYGVGPLRVTAGDPVGFDEAQVQMQGRSEILVYPRVYPLEALGIRGGAVAGLVKSPRRYIEDPTRVAGIRDHTAGESIRHVHWKATAHTGSLKVKSFESTHQVDVVVLLDLVRDHYLSWNAETMSELAIELAASLLAEGCHKRQQFGLFALARLAGEGAPLIATGMRKGEAHLAYILEMLARMELEGRSASLSDALVRVAANAAPNAVVFVVAPRVDSETQQALVRLAREGRRLVVVEVSDEPQGPPLPQEIGYARVGYRGDITKTMARRNPVAVR